MTLKSFLRTVSREGSGTSLSLPSSPFFVTVAASPLRSRTPVPCIGPSLAMASRRRCSDSARSFLAASPFAPSILSLINAAFFASVISFSTNGRSSFAFGTVVLIDSWVISARLKLRKSAMRCSVFRPRRRPLLRWRMGFLPGDLHPVPRKVKDGSPLPQGERGRKSAALRQLHAQVQAALFQFRGHFLERGFAEVPHFEEFVLGADDEVAHRRDAFAFEAVGRPHGQFE